MKKLVIGFIVFSFFGLSAQNVTIRELSNPDACNNTLFKVQLFSTGEALFLGETIDLYSNGDSIFVLSGINNGGGFSAIEKDGAIYALSLKNDTCLYNWDNNTKKWHRIYSKTPTCYKFSDFYIISPKQGLFIGDNLYEDSITIWRFDINNSSFHWIKSFEKRIWFNVMEARDNDVLILSYNYNSDETIIMSYDYDSAITVVDRFQFIADRWATIDHNIFYFLSGDSRDSLIKWNSTTLEKELVYFDSLLTFHCLSMFMMSEDEFIFTGDYVYYVNISSGKTEKLLSPISSFGYIGSSYNQSLKKALIIGSYNGRIFEMENNDNSIIVVDDYDSTDIIKIYPNPVKDKMIIEASFFISKIEAYDNLGKKIFSDGEINISGLKPGVYFLKIYDFFGKNIVTKKIIKQ